MVREDADGGNENGNDGGGRVTRSLGALLDDDRVWLATALLAGSVVVASYYLTHPYPSYATALFPHMAEVLVENGYRRPEVVPYYTEGGIPFAYPPLMFYVMALLIDLGVDPFQLVRLLPGIATVLALIPYFYLAREFLPTRRAGFATVTLAVVPQAVRWHISGGGTVRAPAFLLVVAGLYAGVRLFRTGDRRWIVPGAVLFGLTMLTHPVYMAYFGIAYLVLFASLSRSLNGLVDGAAVAAGGTVLGAPWWLHVWRTYGLETIANAAGTHGGLLDEDFESIVNSVLLFHSSAYVSETIIGFLVLAGAIYMLSKRRYVLPVWFVVTAVVITQQRFAFVPGAMLIGVAVAGAVVPWLADVASGRDERGTSEEVGGPPGRRASASESTRPLSEESPSGREAVAAVALAALVLTTTWFGALYVAGEPPDGDRSSMSAYVDGDDIEAMEWAASETPADARFVVLGDAAEWFPYVAERTGLVGWWGVEWTTPEQYDRQRAMHADLTACDDAACVTEALEEHDLDPDYVYVPNGEYTSGSHVQTQDEAMRETMVESDRYELAYENEGVMVFRVTGEAEGRSL